MFNYIVHYCLCHLIQCHSLSSFVLWHAINITIIFVRRPGSVVGVATGYGLDGPGIESRWGARFSAPIQTGPGAHPSSCTVGTGSFMGVKSGRGVTLTPHPLLVLWSWKSRGIPLLPLWAVRPVQSLSVCTRGALYFYFYLKIRFDFYSKILLKFVFVMQKLYVLCKETEFFGITTRTFWLRSVMFWYIRIARTLATDLTL